MSGLKGSFSRFNVLKICIDNQIYSFSFKSFSTIFSNSAIRNVSSSILGTACPTVRPFKRTTLAGIPTTVAPGGTSFKTTAPAPIRAPAPISTGPSTFAPAETSAPSPTVGWRFPQSFPVPPSVTPWNIVTSSPISAVSPITIPAP
ncbi:mucin [Listeria monocytogenes str. 4b H7858]|nr:mucin [Listeria monocytogenes str. 4b H7858] [Listeria monocytogenes serotype 4b str. H7858]